MAWRVTPWRQLNVGLNLLVIAGGLLILLSPIASRFLYNGRTPLLALVRQTVAAQIIQAVLRLWIEVTSRERRWEHELPRALIALVSLGGVVAVGRFIWRVVLSELERD